MSFAKENCHNLIFWTFPLVGVDQTLDVWMIFIMWMLVGAKGSGQAKKTFGSTFEGVSWCSANRRPHPLPYPPNHHSTNTLHRSISRKPAKTIIDKRVKGLQCKSIPALPETIHPPPSQALCMLSTPLNQPPSSKRFHQGARPALAVSGKVAYCPFQTASVRQFDTSTSNA